MSKVGAESQRETTSVIQVRDDGCVGPGGDDGDGEERSHSGYILKLESTGFPKGSEGAYERERSHQGSSAVFGLTNSKNGVSIH